jgi:HSP20 family molecular chaperone IbpA
MTAELQLGGAQSVPVVEADVLDEMNETDGLIAERAYEIYQSSGGERGSDQSDLFEVEQRILDPLAIHGEVNDGVFRLTAQIPGFDANDLEVVVGHRRAVICGVHPDSDRPAGTHRNRTVMRIIELPFDVDPATTRATLQSGTLQIVLARCQQG